MARRIRSAWLVLLVSALILLMSALHALAGAGDLDPTFSGNGKVRTRFPEAGSYAYGFGVAIQTDGKIVVVGAVVAPDPNYFHQFGLVRYNLDGTLDTTFDSDGRVERKPSNFAIARVTLDGSLDPTFSGNGKVKIDFRREDGALVGIFTERDVLRAFDQMHADPARVSLISKGMTPDPLTIGPNATVGEAMDRMLEGGFRYLPVMEAGTLLDIVSMRDLARSISKG